MHTRKNVPGGNHGPPAHRVTAPPDVLPEVLELVLADGLDEEVGSPSLEALEDHLHGVVGRHHWGEKREGETLEEKVLERSNKDKRLRRASTAGEKAEAA